MEYPVKQYFWKTDRNNFDLDRMKQEYDSKTFEELCQLVRSTGEEAFKKMVEHVNVLIYIQMTERYKDDPYYRNKDFGYFLEDMTGMTLRNYETNKAAIGIFAPECKQIGIEKVIRVVKKFGSKDIARSRRSLDDLIEIKNEKGKIRTDDLEKVIKKHEEPKKVISLLPSRTIIEKERQDYREKYYDLQQVIKERDDQIRKLILTVEQRDEKYKKSKKEIEKLKHQLVLVTKKYLKEKAKVKELAKHM